ncbi:MAG: 2-C-methyl-D-erythritol 2,4-cyclodiphosphate synthase [Bacteroidetes bacterium RIFCSPHIGHO2_02_FULL_44_7]|nr:MAG: 2-C-methyl-D-erythritol 2,4-cyclodiphosphate synthase [Bacteroidetes bacterium RIFCSPHIGHO2_02_FULL_44_7]
MDLRIGYGVDVHRLQEGLPLHIGGILIPSELGAIGHSDADVLLHAICDALLGAANLRDIGYHFSDKDPQYKNIESSILLSKVSALVHEKGYSVVNIDSTVILEQPRLNPYIPKMQKLIADILGLDQEAVSIKASTHEQVDSFGEGRAIKAYAVCLLHR